MVATNHGAPYAEFIHPGRACFPASFYSLNLPMPSYRPSPDVVATELDDDEAVLLSLETQRYYSMNETGTRVWQLLSAGEAPEAIARAITQEWDTTMEESLAYVESFLEELADEGLVEKTDA